MVLCRDREMLPLTTEMSNERRSRLLSSRITDLQIIEMLFKTSFTLCGGIQKFGVVHKTGVIHVHAMFFWLSTGRLAGLE
jgi:hypothetical protein